MIPDIYDPQEDILEEAFYSTRVPLRHLASELKEAYGYKSERELQVALLRTFEVCCALDISIAQHFRKVYMYANGEMKSDWLLSDLGSYLLLMNGSARNRNVAKAQLYMVSIMRKMQD